MFGIHIREPSGRAPVAEQDQAPAYVVALKAEGAPCGLVFFDGTEKWIEADGMRLILPGGAFFAAEARLYASDAEALAQAIRLNRASPALEHPWRAIPLQGRDGTAEPMPAPRRSRAGIRSRR